MQNFFDKGNELGGFLLILHIMAKKKDRDKAPNERRYVARYRNPARFRLDFIKENTLNRVWSLRMTRSRVVIVSIAVVASVGALLWAIIAFTPLRGYLPGALRGDLRGRYVETSLRVDSLEERMRVQNQWLTNLRAVLSGDVSDSINVYDVQPLAIADTLVAASEAERRFVRQYEEQERFNLSVLAPLAADGMVFVSPVAPTATVTGSPTGMTVTGSRGMPLSAVYRGTVVSVVTSSAGTTTLTVQHPNDFITVYTGLGDVFVNKGSRVSAGQRLGHAASSVAAIEMWHNGSELNPAEYIIGL